LRLRDPGGSVILLSSTGFSLCAFRIEQRANQKSRRF